MLANDNFQQNLYNNNNNSGNLEHQNKIITSRSKKTKGRVKIKMEFIENKIRRYTTFSKRKTGIMKKVFILFVCLFFFLQLFCN